MRTKKRNATKKSRHVMNDETHASANNAHGCLRFEKRSPVFTYVFARFLQTPSNTGKHGQPPSGIGGDESLLQRPFTGGTSAFWPKADVRECPETTLC